MTLPRPCLGCGAIIPKGSRCRACTPNLYGGDYARRAAETRASTDNCHWCRKPFTADNPPQADHVIPGDPMSELVNACRYCNATRTPGGGVEPRR